MKMLRFEAFADHFGRAAKPTMNMSIYRDNFACACGKSHWFDERIKIICEGAIMKIMVECPENPAFVTALKIKTFLVFKFKGFESLAGTKIESEEERQMKNLVYAAVRR